MSTISSTRQSPHPSVKKLEKHLHLRPPFWTHNKTKKPDTSAEVIDFIQKFQIGIQDRQKCERHRPESNPASSKNIFLQNRQTFRSTSKGKPPSWDKGCILTALASAELEEETRPLAPEARAHVIVQWAIDEMHREGTLPRPTPAEFLTWVHKNFYDEMPGEFRVIEHPEGTQEPIVPRRMRQDDDQEVAVGRHLPPSSSRVAAFIDHFDKRFQIAARSSSGRIIAIASAHHRLN